MFKPRLLSVAKPKFPRTPRRLNLGKEKSLKPQKIGHLKHGGKNRRMAIRAPQLSRETLTEIWLGNCPTNLIFSRTRATTLKFKPLLKKFPPHKLFLVFARS